LARATHHPRLRIGRGGAAHPQRAERRPRHLPALSHDLGVAAHPGGDVVGERHAAVRPPADHAIRGRIVRNDAGAVAAIHHMVERRAGYRHEDAWFARTRRDRRRHRDALGYEERPRPWEPEADRIDGTNRGSIVPARRDAEIVRPPATRERQ
jgi:hypothetical protein